MPLVGIHSALRAGALTWLLLAPARAVALDGVVIDQWQMPVANAEVTILGRPGVAHTDAEGRFVWSPTPKPPFEVLVTMPGGRFMKPVFVEWLPSAGAITIHVTPLVDASVTVSGAAPHIKSMPAGGTTMLTAREIAVRQPANLAEALETVAGVSTVSEGHAAVPVLRGLARGRTLILIDGARVTAERRVGPSATFLDPFVLESVEVARGPGSVAYGSDAFGGVIYARTRRVQPGAPLGVRLSGSFGAGVPDRRSAVEVSKGFAKGGVLFSAHRRQASDYTSHEGLVFNSGFQDQGFHGRAEHAVGRGIMSVAWQSDWARDVERPRDNSRTVRVYYPTEDSHRFTASYTLDDFASFDRAGIDAFMGGYRVVTDQDRAPTASAPRSIERAEVSARDFSIRAYGQRRAGGARLETGIDVNGRYGLEALDISVRHDLAGSIARTVTNASVENAHRTDAGAYLSIDAAVLPAVSLSSGIRADRVVTTNEGGHFGDRSTTNGSFSGFAAVTVGSFRGLTLTGQVARGFRDPVLSERYFRGPSGRGFMSGNPDLESETSLQFDLAARYTSSRYRLALYAYDYRIDRLIERYEAAPDEFLFRNRGRGRLRGAEVEAQVHVTSGLAIQAAVQLARGVANDRAPLDDVAAPSIALQVTRQLGERGFVQLSCAAFERDGRAGPTEIDTPGHAVFDVSGGFELTQKLELQLRVRNLLDQSYPASPDPRTVLAPGISALATTVLTF